MSNTNSSPDVDYRHLVHLSLEVAHCDSLDAFAVLAITQIASLIPARPILLGVLRKDTLQIVGREPAIDSLSTTLQPPDNDILFSAWQSGLPFIGDTQNLTESPLTTLLKAAQITAFVSVPIRLKGASDGAILCGGTLSPAETQTLTAYAQLIAPHLYHLNLLAQRDNERITTEIFQRIDRELTETINLKHVFVMMLDWALRFTNASTRLRRAL